MRIVHYAIGALVALVVLFLSTGLFVVREGSQAIVLEMGRPVRTIQDSGLYWCWPLAQNVLFFDKRVLDLTPSDFEVLLTDKKRIVIGANVRYRIEDPLLFFERVREESFADDRLGRAVNAALRRVVAQVSLQELLSSMRVKVMGDILQEISELAGTFGVRIVDVRIGRTELPTETEQAVFARMKAEREREAKELRSEGMAISEKIKAEANRDASIIVALAKRKAAALRGQGDAMRADILGRTFQKDVEFFKFYESMLWYKKSLKGSVFMLSPQDNAFMELFARSSN